MSLTPIPANEVLAQLDLFDAVIDARSEDEYAEDRLPGAINWPTLDNAERIEIGTLYKQVNPFEARKRGAAIAARNIAEHIEREVIDKPKDWKPLTYCWRGGQRSGSLSLILSQIGFKVTIVEGGYKAFRAALVQDTVQRVAQLKFQVVCGPTGNGKTRLLQAMRACGAQVLDLEDLANHRSSVLGAVPGLKQPSQKSFDTLIWNQLRLFDITRPVFVESESKKVGNLSVPMALIDGMRSSPCLNLVLPDQERVALLLEDYDHLVRDVDYFCGRLDALTPLKGRSVVQAWQAQAQAGEFAPVVLDLLHSHYDPAYLQSMVRNFKQFEAAVSLHPRDRSPESMMLIAQQVINAS
jgi:tRNA 2-selenouridine synthase